MLTILPSKYHTKTSQELGKLNSVGKPISYVDLRIVDQKCPTIVSFRLDDLPITNINKIDKKAIRALYAKQDNLIA